LSIACTLSAEALEAFESGALPVAQATDKKAVSMPRTTKIFGRGRLMLVLGAAGNSR